MRNVIHSFSNDCDGFSSPAPEEEGLGTMTELMKITAHGIDEMPLSECRSA